MPAENTDTPSTGIDVNTAASQLEALLDAEEGQAADDEEEAAGATAGDDAEEADGEETAPEDSDEDVDVEDDEASEDDEQPDTKAEEEFEIDLGRGEKVKVKRDELIKGYLRQSDYTRKTQEVAEGRKRLESEATEVLRERTQYSVLLGALEQQLKLAEKADEPDWDALYQQNPIQAVQYERKWRAEKAERQEKLAAVEAEKARLTEATQQQELRQFREYVQEQNQILTTELLPEWSNPKVARRERAEIAEYALSVGLSPEEVKTLADARAVVLLRKAMKFDRAMARKQASLQGDKPATSGTLKPGTAAAKPSVKVEVKKQFSRLQKTGSVQDAAKLFEQML